MRIAFNSSEQRGKKALSTYQRYINNANKAGYSTSRIGKAPWGQASLIGTQQIPRRVYMGLSNG